MVINKDLREFIQCLNHHNTSYLIVGGYAVALHGHLRYTQDMDEWIGVNKKASGRYQDLADLENLE